MSKQLYQLRCEFGARGTDYARAQVRPHLDGSGWYVQVLDCEYVTVLDHVSKEEALQFAHGAANVYFVSEPVTE